MAKDTEFITASIRHLTKMITGDKHGEHGVDFENEVFVMRKYCWCDEEDCESCNGGAPNFFHKRTQARAWWYKHTGRGVGYDIGDFEWHEIFYECFKSLEKKADVTLEVLNKAQLEFLLDLYNDQFIQRVDIIELGCEELQQMVDLGIIREVTGYIGEEELYLSVDEGLVDLAIGSKTQEVSQ